jgi:hypothetical protein
MTLPGNIAFSSLTTVARALGGEVNGGQVLAPGPGHQAKDRSLCVKLDASAPDGFLVHSFSGDDAFACRDHVRERLNIPAFKPNGDGRRQTNGASFNIVAAYDYVDGDGTLLYQVLRLDPKDFRQRRPDGKGGWVWGIRDVKRVPYHLPDLIAYRSATIFLTEGEKDTERLRMLSLCATTLSGGSKWTAEIIEYFRGRDVVVVPDHDAAGREKAKQAASALRGVAASIRVVTLPGLSGEVGSKDVSNWLDSDPAHTDEFVKLCLATPEWIPSPGMAEHFNGGDEPITRRLILSSAQFVSGFVPPDYVIFGLLQRRFLYSLTGKTGAGKTAILLRIAARTLQRAKRSMTARWREGACGISLARMLTTCGCAGSLWPSKWVSICKPSAFTSFPA